VDAGVYRVEKKDDEVVNFEDANNFASLDDEVIMETIRFKVSDINVQKLENKDGHLKVDVKNGTWLEDKSDNYHDIENISGEYHFLFALTNGDREESALLISHTIIACLVICYKYKARWNQQMVYPLMKVYTEKEKLVEAEIRSGEAI
jgi:hypothetical protein